MAGKELLSGKDVHLFIKHPVYTNGQWKMVVCETSLSLDEGGNESTTATKCGTFTTPGADDNTITLDMVFVKGEPAPGELTAKIIKKIRRSKTQFEFRIADAYPSAVELSDSGTGIITGKTEEHPAEGFSTMSVTIKVNGEIVDEI